MHATQLAKMATNFAFVGHALTADDVRAVGDAAHGYWLANRFRCDAWHQRISAHRSAVERCGTSNRARLWREVIPTMQEILISEPLARVIAYLAGQLEIRQADADWGALSHSVLDSHIEARHRCLSLMVFGHGLPVESAVQLNRLRRLLEFFNDQLLGASPPQSKVAAYAFEPALVTATQAQFRRYPVCGRLQEIRLISLSTAVEQLLNHDHQPQGANPRLNVGIAEAALAMLPHALFDSFGIVRGRVLETVARSVTESPVTTHDVAQPLAAPFDLLAQHARPQNAKTSRRF